MRSDRRYKQIEALKGALACVNTGANPSCFQIFGGCTSESCATMSMGDASCESSKEGKQGSGAINDRREFAEASCEITTEQGFGKGQRFDSVRLKTQMKTPIVSQRNTATNRDTNLPTQDCEQRKGWQLLISGGCAEDVDQDRLL
jgi:hypothetical protein